MHRDICGVELCAIRIKVRRQMQTCGIDSDITRYALEDASRRVYVSVYIESRRVTMRSIHSLLHYGRYKINYALLSLSTWHSMHLCVQREKESLYLSHEMKTRTGKGDS